MSSAKVAKKAAKRAAKAASPAKPPGTIYLLKQNVAAFIKAWTVPRAFDDRITTSWLIPPLHLACIRLLFSLYAFAIFFIFAWNGIHHYGESSRRSFSYFTDLSYWGLAFYFLISGIHTFLYARTGKTWLHSWPRVWSSAHNIFYVTVVTFPFLVTVVYWAFLYPRHWFPTWFYAWSNVKPSPDPRLMRSGQLTMHQISRHAMNSCFALFEIIIPRTNPPPVLHLWFLVLLLLFYLALAEVTYVDQGFYPYRMLDPSGGYDQVAAYAFAILASIFALFVVVWYIIGQRKRLTEEMWKMKGKLFVPPVKPNPDLEMSGALQASVTTSEE
jgi:hypothetical protein